MRKLAAIALIFTMCLGMTACGGDTTTAEPTVAPTTAPAADPKEDLVAAKNYLHTMYKDNTETTPADYLVVGVINIGGKLFDIEWTADSDTIKFVKGDDKMVTVDIDEKNPEELAYVLTATLSDGTNKESVSFKHKVPAYVDLSGGASYADIVDAAYKLEDGLAMEGTHTLYGTVTKIDTPWSAEYKNISVVIAVAGKEDQPILCYRLSGEGAENLKEGDAITVEGTLKNYKGTIEFDKGCVLVGYGEHKDYTTILDACYQLEDGASMTEPLTMSGIITKIDTPYSAEYKNITVIITVNDKAEQPIMCYRLSGEGADALAVGDYITVTGIVKNYKGTIEFDKGCTLDNVVKAAGSADAPVVEEAPAVDPTGMTADQILDAAYGLADGAAFAAPCTLTGVITEINSEYSEQYGNITVTIVVNGKEDKKIECFRLVGDGIATLAVGDNITVTGIMKNYKGKIEFDAKCNLDAVAKPEGETTTPVEETTAPEETTTALDFAGIDLTVGLTAGVDYNGISVLEDMAVKDANPLELNGVTYTTQIQGTNNPSPKNGAVPETGAAVKITPTANGTFVAVFKLGAGKTYHFIDADATDIDTYKAEGTESEYLYKEYPVEAGKTYYLYGDGTKLPFYFLGLK